MASHNWAKDLGTLEHGLIELDGVLSLSSAAAVVAATTRFTGGVFAKTGTGLYTLTFDDSYASVICVGLTQCFTGAAPGNIFNTMLKGTVASQDVTTNKLITFVTVNNANALTDTTAAMDIAITVLLKNSSVV